MRAALRLSWLEIQPARGLRGHAVRTGRHKLAVESETACLSLCRERRRCVDLYGAEATNPARARLRMDARARDPSFCLQDIRELQLAARAGRRTGYLAFLLRA